MQSDQCILCKHYNLLGQCDAFPDKIPQEIFDGTFDHTEAYPGDNGIKFESVKKSNGEKMIEIDVNSIKKAEKRVRVKATSTRKSHYRTIEGAAEAPRVGRRGTGKIASLPNDMKNEILDLRRLGDSGATIKSQIENMIDSSEDMSLKENLTKQGIIETSTGPAKLQVTGQSLVDWAKARGVESTKKRKTVKAVESEAKATSESQFESANKKLAHLQAENKELKSRLEILQRSKTESDKLRSELNTQNFLLKEKLKTSASKPSGE